MTARPQLRVLFFDVFGTCVGQRTPVADELSKAAKEALENDEINSDVRNKLESMVRASNVKLCWEDKLIDLAVV